MMGLLLSLRREPVLEGGGATSLGEALGLVSRLAQQRSLVAIVSDFRGPRDWRPPLLQLAGGHDILAIEIRDPREETLPNVGELRLVDPETGRQLRVDTASRRLRERFAAAAAAERAEVARELTSLGVGPRRPLDRRRLAAAARRLPATAGSPTVSFAWPLALLSLLLVPLAIAGYVALERRRHRQAALFASPALVPNLDRPAARLAATRRPRARARRARAARDRARPPAREGLGEARGGDGRPRDRHVPLDGRDGRQAEPARGRAEGGPHLPRQAAEGLPRRRWSRSPTPPPSSSPPTANREAAKQARQQPAPGRRNGRRRGNRARRPGRGPRARRGAARRLPRRSSSSPTARRRRADPAAPGGAARQEGEDPRLHRLARHAGRRRRGARRRRLHPARDRPAGSGHDAEDRRRRPARASTPRPTAPGSTRSTRSSARGSDA